MRSLPAQTRVHGLDEHVRGPKAGGGAPARIVIPRRLSRSHLIQRHAFLLQVPYPIANDSQHVAVVSNIGSVAQSAVAWDYIRSSLLIARRDHHAKNLVQRVKFTLDAAAMSQVDDRITDGRKNIARADDIGPAKENHAVAVSVRILRMDDANAFVIEEQVLPRS